MVLVRLLTRLVPLVLLAGTVLLLVFVVLSGGTDHYPFDRFYWLEVRTTDFETPFDLARWTYWGLCENVDGRNRDCVTGPAYPISPEDNFEGDENLNSDFISNRDTYFFLSRFGNVFLLLGLIFSGVSFILTFLSSVLKSARVTLALFLFLATLFTAGGAALMTAVVVLARNHFDGVETQISANQLGCTWGAVATIFLTVAILSTSSVTTAYRRHKEALASQQNYEQQQGIPPNTGAPVVGTQQDIGDLDSQSPPPLAGEPTAPTQNESGIRFFKIRHNKKVTTADDESL
ncbi:hypothetical protein LJB42_004088 [Komagataella kurtzmanii]|nr:hypothetical protein LJB42_004088 [Komagataella kurtzmanii]